MRIKQSKEDMIYKATPFIALAISLFLAWMIWRGYIKTLDTPLGIIREGSAPLVTAFVVATLIIATGFIIRRCFYLIVTILFLASCSPRFCQPSKKSADYAWKIQEIKKKGSAYRVKLTRGMFQKVYWFECLNDSIKVGSYISNNDLKAVL